MSLLSALFALSAVGLAGSLEATSSEFCDDTFAAGSAVALRRSSSEFSDDASAEESESMALLQVTKVRHRLDKDPFPPLGLVKVHKAASTTMLKLVQQLAFERGLKIMFPKDDIFLGYPGRWPGAGNAVELGPPQHQYDVICNHGVFNSSAWQSYLKPKPLFIASLREPSSQALGVRDYWYANHTWDEYLSMVEGLQAEVTVSPDWQTAVRLNPQAWDLGWYEYVGKEMEFVCPVGTVPDCKTTAHDRNETMINQWLALLDQDLGGLGSVVLTEWLDEGLVLLSKRLGIDVQELVYLSENSHPHGIEPTDQELGRLAQLSPVDRALYSHFNISHWKHWQSYNNSLDSDVARLRQLATDQAACCGQKDCECPVVWALNEGHGTAYLHLLDRGDVLGAENVATFVDGLNLK